MALPCVLAVGPSGPAPRPCAYAAARRGRIVELGAARVTDSRRAHWQETTARARSKRIRVSRSANASERMLAATVVTSSGGTAMQPASTDEAAAVILDYLHRIGICKG